MSATNRGMDRDVLDRRMTPQACADEVARVLRMRFIPPEPFDPIIVEPSAGGASFVRALHRELPGAGIVPAGHIIACDLRPECESTCREAGAEEFVSGDWPAIAAEFRPESVHVIVGNPPFSQAMAHIDAGLPLLVPGGILAFILRVGFYDDEDRAAMLWDGRGLRAVLPLRPRPSFGVNAKGKKGQDSASYAVWVFRKGYVGGVDFGPPIVWRETQKRVGKKSVTEV